MKGNIKTNISVADDVIPVIAGISATSVEGVYSLSNNITSKALGFIPSNKLKNGIIILKDKDGNNLDISINIVLKDGYDIREVCEKIQEKVKESIESMLDLKVKNVAVRVAQINMV